MRVEGGKGAGEQHSRTGNPFFEKGDGRRKITPFFKEKGEFSTWVLPGRDSGLAKGDTEPSALWQPNAVRQPFIRNIRKIGPSRKDLPASANLRVL